MTQPHADPAGHAAGSVAGVVGQADAWDRFDRVWHGLFAVCLLVPTAMAALDPDLPTGDRPVVVGVAAAYGLWHWVALARGRHRWERLAPMALYWLVALGFIGVLAGLHGSFTILLYGIYPLLFASLGWWALGPAVLVTGVVGWRTGFLDSGAEAVITLAANGALAAGLGIFITRIAEQSTQRRTALDALAATRAELAETARHAGVLEERARVARELHDTVAQSLASVVTHLEAAEQALEQGAGGPAPERVRHHLDRARATARSGLSEVRRSVHALRPDLLEGHTLAEALQTAAARWSATSGVLATVAVTGDPEPLPVEVETALLRTAQEALANVARHAGATRVVLTLSHLGGEVALDVDDDGRGFDPDAVVVAEGSGFGLTAMAERLAAVGGTLVVEGRPGGGTTVAAQVPSAARVATEATRP